MTKPIVFNYKQYEELRDAYRALLEDNNKLMADNKKLRAEKTNLEIRCRIAEADRPKVAYLCDGRACGSDCRTTATDCELTTDIAHARNFERQGTGYYYEVDYKLDKFAEDLAGSIANAIGSDVKEILETVKKLEGE